MPDHESTPEPLSVDAPADRPRCPYTRGTNRWPYIERCQREPEHEGKCRTLTGEFEPVPDKYLGVPIPETLRPNWHSTPEAAWWKHGVRAALAAVKALS